MPTPIKLIKRQVKLYNSQPPEFPVIARCQIQIVSAEIQYLSLHGNEFFFLLMVHSAVLFISEKETGSLAVRNMKLGIDKSLCGMIFI